MWKSFCATEPDGIAPDKNECSGFALKKEPFINALITGQILWLISASTSTHYFRRIRMVDHLLRNNGIKKSMNYLLAGVLAAGLVFPSLAGANPHTTVAKKNTPEGFDNRDHLEGTSGVLNHFRIPHGCNGKAIRAMSVVFPNGETVSTRTDTNDPVTLSDHIEGNAIRGPKPVQDRDIFRRIETKDGPVPPFSQSGSIQTTDIRAFYYEAGRLETHLVGMLPWDASFPTFKPESCAVELEVGIGIGNYCNRTNNDDRADIWLGRFTPLFNDPAVVVTGHWSHVKVVRDLVNNPLDGACGAGFEILVTPADEDIDTFLPVNGYWPAN